MSSFKPIRLISDRLVLRWLEESDLPALFGIFSSAEVMRYWSSPPFTQMADAQKMLLTIQEGYRSGNVLQLGIERSSDQVLIGTCTLHNFHLQSRRAEIGYALGRPYWGQGYMREALHILIDYAFDTLNLNRLEADIDPRNSASKKSLERLGFLKEGHLRERWIVNGEVSDTGFYGLLRSHWLKRSGDGV
jgi:ribosomal-protein-alanine N-acetyltransferase